MIKRMKHVGLAVENLEAAGEFFRKHFHVPISEHEHFGELVFSFIPLEGTTLELLQSTSDNGQIAKFIRNRGQGVHHIALEVDDVQAELDRLKGEGLTLINEKPYVNAHGDLVAFLHPKSTYGVLIELIQSREEV